MQVLKSKYKVTDPYKVIAAGENSSWVWKGILSVLPQLKEGMCILPKNGATVNLREDPWLPSGMNFRLAWRNDSSEA